MRPYVAAHELRRTHYGGGETTITMLTLCSHVDNAVDDGDDDDDVDGVVC